MSVAATVAAAARTGADAGVAGDAGTGTGLAVAAACAALLLGVGLAHYAGAWRWLAQVGLLSATTAASLAWIGGGGLLVCGALALDGAEGGPGAVGTLVLGAAGLVVAAIGLVGVVWLPGRLRPRWMRQGAGRPEGPRGDGRMRA